MARTSKSIKKASTGVVAVIVTYQVSPELLLRLPTLLTQVDKLIIVDNGSEAMVQATLESMAESDPAHFIFIANSANLGLAKAQNQGIERALVEGAGWVLLLDDDSKPYSDMLSHMLAASAVPFADGTLPQFLAPDLIQPATGLATRYVVPKFGRLGFARVALKLASRDTPHLSSTRGAQPSRGEGQQNISPLPLREGQGEGYPYLDEALVVVASGSLLSRALLERCGLMREAFFIDYIDTEFALRARKFGFRIRVVKAAKLEHHIGAKEKHTLMGGTVVTSNHSPMRRYTIFRNRVVMWRQYWLCCSNYVIYDIMAAFYDIARIASLEENPFTKLKQVFRGIGHGLIGKLGAP